MTLSGYIAISSLHSGDCPWMGICLASPVHLIARHALFSGLTLFQGPT